MVTDASPEPERESAAFAADPPFTAGTLCAPQTLTGGDGAELIACAHGGHILGWTPAGGRPRLWLSPTAECGPGLAIRGGIPVIFPQFAGRGPLPKHGLARNRGWQVTSGPLIDESGTEAAFSGVSWQATLMDDDETRAIWPQRFQLSLTARAAGNELTVTLTVTNSGEVAWTFAAALHSYLALGDPAATIHGLGGRTAQNNAAAGQPVTLGSPGEALPATQARDVAVLAAPDPLLLDDPVLGPLRITAAGFPDRVVWNPGPGHGLSDVPDGAERDFVCVEPAALTAVSLAPAAVWTASLSLHSEAR